MVTVIVRVKVLFWNAELKALAFRFFFFPVV